MNVPSRVTVRVEINGRVQGVWYRAWTEREASARGLGGWVRNCRDGSVEAVFSGPPEIVDEMLLACRSGPPAANVVDIKKFPAEFTEIDFSVLPTA